MFKIELKDLPLYIYIQTVVILVDVSCTSVYHRLSILDQREPEQRGDAAQKYYVLNFFPGPQINILPTIMQHDLYIHVIQYWPLCNNMIFCQNKTLFSSETSILKKYDFLGHLTRPIRL